ncbi:kinase-like domain-containing protein [Rhizophagus clarus]|uniref:Kinase-like domain-containing protein n=1 Tax=Rhizophagus clarus TaxID=94130 RepID=A0A8H3MB47_9GLOM|nr:kinase-like domain-containing protein [Rhizophagus clarus]
MLRHKDIVHHDLLSKNILVDFGLSHKVEVSSSVKNIVGVLPYIDSYQNKTNYNKNHPKKFKFLIHQLII